MTVAGPETDVRRFAADGTRIFAYGTRETDYLAERDPRLGEVIAAVGHVERPVDPDLCSSVIHQIIGQQISTKALATIWARTQAALGEVTPGSLLAAGEERLQSFGMSHRKAQYITAFARKVDSGQFDLEALRHMDDAEATAALCTLDGVGVWTAEMILLFCMERPNVLSFGDLAIQRGLRMVHHHRRITPALHRRYLRRYTPYASVASLYLWEVAGGAIPGLKGLAPKR